MLTLFYGETGGSFEFSASTEAVSGYIDVVSPHRQTSRRVMYRFDGYVLSGYLRVNKELLVGLRPGDGYTVFPQTVDSSGKIYYLEPRDLEVYALPEESQLAVVSGSSILERLSRLESGGTGSFSGALPDGYVTTGVFNSHVITTASTSADGHLTSVDKVKLDGVQAGATANATNEQLRDRATHTGTQPMSSIDGLDTALSVRVLTGDSRLSDSRTPVPHTHEIADVNGLQSTIDGAWQALQDHASSPATQSVDGHLSSADKTKLDGISSGATANATDAQLRDRATHTGVQSISSVTGLGDALNAKMSKVVHQQLTSVGGLTSWDANLGVVATITMSESTALSLPTNIEPGMTLMLRVVQDATGGRALSFGSGFSWLSGSAAVSTTPNSVTLCTFVCFSPLGLIGTRSVVQ